jgi:hypothetical protein
MKLSARMTGRLFVAFGVAAIAIPALAARYDGKLTVNVFDEKTREPQSARTRNRAESPKETYLDPVPSP